MTDLESPKAPVPEPRRPEEGELRRNPTGPIALGALLVLAGYGGGWPLLVVIASLLIMIFLHELGHYMTAKWAGMKVTEFFIGFGPRIWSFHRGETEYGLKAIPLGAYVRIIGMNNLDEVDPGDEDRTYMSKPFWRRLSVAVAGSTMHFVQAFLGLLLLFAVVGVPGGSLRPETQAWIVGTDAIEDTAAERIGILAGDRILSVDGIATPTFDEFGEVVQARPGEEVRVVYERGGETASATVELGVREVDGEEQGFFGVGPDFPVMTVGAVDAVRESVGNLGYAVTQTIAGIGEVLSPAGLGDLGREVVDPGPSGPVVGDGGSAGGGSGSGEAQPTNRPVSIIGVGEIASDLLRDGSLAEALLLFVVVNVFIGVFNLVPLLPLDGGHVVIAVYEKIRSMLRGGVPYHVDVAKLLPVTYAVVMLLVFLGISTVYLDTRSLIGG